MWLLPILVAAIGLSDATRHSHHRQHRQSSHRATSPKSGFFTLDNGRSVKIATPKPSEDVSASGVENVRTLFPIRYQWNGAVMTDPVNVYAIYYGNWTVNQIDIVDNFFIYIGESDWYTTNMKYYQQAKATEPRVYVQDKVTLAKSIVDNYSYGYTLKSSWDVIQTHLAKGNLPLDVNGVYFVMSSDDVDMSGFCNQWCGWHDFQAYNGIKVKHSFIGVPPPFCRGCSANDGVKSPNGEAMVDALVDTLAHELVEAISDPELNAWYDLRHAENGDKCNWHYGKSRREENGAEYNILLGERKYLIQQNWDPIAQNCSGGFSVDEDAQF